MQPLRIAPVVPTLIAFVLSAFTVMIGSTVEDIRLKGGFEAVVATYNSRN